MFKIPPFKILLLSLLVFTILISIYFKKRKKGIINVLEVSKIKHIPDSPYLNKYIKYNIRFEANKDFEINKISLENKDSVKEIAEYSFINYDNSEGYKVVEFPKKFCKGNYEFLFSIEDYSSFHLRDFLKICFSTNYGNDLLKILVKNSKIEIEK